MAACSRIPRRTSSPPPTGFVCLGARPRYIVPACAHPAAPFLIPSRPAASVRYGSRSATLTSSNPRRSFLDLFRSKSLSSHPVDEVALGVLGRERSPGRCDHRRRPPLPAAALAPGPLIPCSRFPARTSSGVLIFSLELAIFLSKGVASPPGCGLVLVMLSTCRRRGETQPTASDDLRPAVDGADGTRCLRCRRIRRDFLV